MITDSWLTWPTRVSKDESKDHADVARKGETSFSWILMGSVTGLGKAEGDWFNADCID
jgi:hypothetical protein